ncbi:OmpA family protein [Marinoscillum luteum]|uniref:OmpA family protein n=1 Tax=Marinoscillum luteum TaxID=861051 RepID=A0ABW7NA05_9BACT
MKSRYALLLAFVLTLVIQDAGAQKLKRIKKTINAGLYAKALRMIDTIDQPKEEEQEALQYYRGVSLLQSYRQEEALAALKKSSPSVDEKYPYYLTLAYLQNDSLKAAQSAWGQVDTTLLSQEELELLTIHMNAYESIYLNRKDVVVQNLGPTINSEGHEYNAVITKDQKSVVYTVRRAEMDDMATDGLAYEQILKATLDERGLWENPQQFDRQSSKKHHDATVQLFDHDTKLVTYHDEDLLLSELRDGQWSMPKSLNMLNRLGSAETHCSINETFDTIYYATNFYSANGNLDLYQLTKGADGSWNEPTPLKELNTIYNDDSPYMAANGELYFSSRGHNSTGGYDIFRSRYDRVTGKWSKPENLGHPINSPSDDTYFNVFGKIAYLSSGRTGGYGNMDIYRVFLFNKVRITGQVVDDESDEALPGAEVMVEGPDSTYTATTDEMGRYAMLVPIETVFKLSVTYQSQLVYAQQQVIKVLLQDHNDNVVQLRVNKEGVNGDEVQEQQIAIEMLNDFNVDPERLVPGDMAKPLLATMRVHKPENQEEPIAEIPIPIVHFEFDRSVVTEQYKSTLRLFANEIKDRPGLKLALEGYTDKVGANDYNKLLALKRASAVMDFLVAEGVSSDQLKVNALGEENPLEDTEGESLLNRRVEIKLISSSSAGLVAN